MDLLAEEAGELQRRLRAGTVSVRDRRRSEIILLSAAGLTQQQIADQLGKTVAYVSMLETGEKLPSLDLVRNLSEALAYPNDQLLLLKVRVDTRMHDDDRQGKSRIADQARAAECHSRYFEVENDLHERLEAPAHNFGDRRGPCRLARRQHALLRDAQGASRATERR